MVNTSNDKLPSPRINIAIDRHHVADFQIVVLRDLLTDDTGVSFALEGFELLLVYEKLRSRVENVFSIDS